MSKSKSKKVRGGTAPVLDEIESRLMNLFVPGLTVSIDNEHPARFRTPKTWCKPCKITRTLAHETLLWLDGIYADERTTRAADFAEFLADLESVTDQRCNRPGCILLRHSLRIAVACWREDLQARRSALRNSGTYTTMTGSSWNEEDVGKEVRAALYLCEGGESEQRAERSETTITVDDEAKKAVEEKLHKRQVPPSDKVH